MPPIRPEKRSWKEVNREYKLQKKQRQAEKLEKAEKRKAREEAELAAKKAQDDKPKFEVKLLSTLSIAVPGSILDNAQSLELRTYVAGQIARAACIYKVDEVIVFDDKGDITEGEKKKLRYDETFGHVRPGCLQLAKLLQYLECPQYLRKYFFPLHKDLQYAGLLNPLDAPHHLRQQDVSLFREGVVSNKPIKPGEGSLVNVGLLKDVRIDKDLMSGIRVTVKIPPGQEESKKIKGFVVPPTLPKSETGIYWGYQVKMASSLSDIFAKCPYFEGYDVTIGTSDKGSSIDEIPSKSLKYKHVLIVFGGLNGIEAALDVDPKLTVDDPSLVFHKYLNTCPQQGSRTIRSEEAVLLTLAELRSKLDPEHPPISCEMFNHHEDLQKDDNKVQTNRINSEESDE